MITKAKGKQKRLTSYFQSDEQQNKHKNKNEAKHQAVSSSSRKRPRPCSGGSFRSRNGESGFGICPLCQSSFAWHVLESHASKCTGKQSNDSSDIANNNDNNNDNNNHRIGTTITVRDVGTSGGDKNLSKPSLPMTMGEMPLESGAGEIIPLEDIRELKSPNTRTPKAKTKSTSTLTSTIYSTRNVVTPRLAPIFQAKTKDENTNTNDKALTVQQHPQVRPHSYEPIPGLFVYEDFITEEEEALILKGCVNVGRGVFPAWKLCRFNGKHIGKRWGVHCNLRDRKVDAPEHPLPAVLFDIVFPKLKRLNLPTVSKTLKNFCPNEANAIDYRRNEGHWLKAHVDDRKLSKEPIANLSLVGDCYMTFTNVSKHRNLAVPEQRVLLKRRCLQVLTGKARYDFSHGIANADLLSDRRISVTMRESPLTMAARSR